MAPPLPGFFTFLAGIYAGIAIVFVAMAPILAKGLEAHHHFPPSRRRRRRMTLAYGGMAAGLFCLAMNLLTNAWLLRLLALIVGWALLAVSMVTSSRARDIREPEPLAGQQDTPGGSGLSGPDGPHAT